MQGNIPRTELPVQAPGVNMESAKGNDGSPPGIELPVQATGVNMESAKGEDGSAPGGSGGCRCVVA